MQQVKNTMYSDIAKAFLEEQFANNQKNKFGHMIYFITL